MKVLKLQVALFISVLMLVGISGSLVHAESSIYWTNLTNNLLSRSNVDGSLKEDINPTSYQSPLFSAIERAGVPTDPTKQGKIYFTDQGDPENLDDQTIRVMNLDGSNVKVLFHSFNGLTRQPTDIKLDGRGRMFWTDTHWLTAGIHSANTDGTDHRWEIDIYSLRKPNFGQGIGQALEYAGAWGLALDMVNEKMYWTDFSSRDIHSADLYEAFPGAGITGSVIQVASGFPGLRGIAVDSGDPGTPGSLKLFVTTSSAGDIMSINPVDGAKTTLINANFGTDLQRPMDIEVDPVFHKIYFTDHNDGKVYRADDDGFNVVVVHALEDQIYDKKGRLKTKTHDLLGIALSLDPLVTPPADTGDTTPPSTPSVTEPTISSVVYRSDKEELRIDASMPATSEPVSYYIEIRDTGSGALLFKTENFASGTPILLKVDLLLSSTNMEASAFASNGTVSSLSPVEMK